MAGETRPAGTLLQATVAPGGTLPRASATVAESFVVLFHAIDGGECGVMATLATGSLTFTVADPDAPSGLVAVIVAEPPPRPVTTSVSPGAPLTLAIVGLLLVQVSVRPVSVFPLASSSAAVSVTVALTVTAPGLGEIATVLTGSGFTVIGTWVCLPWAGAIRTSFPAALPVTKPLVLTLAMAPPDCVLRAIATPGSRALFIFQRGVEGLHRVGLREDDRVGSDIDPGHRITHVYSCGSCGPDRAVAAIVAEPAPTPVTI